MFHHRTNFRSRSGEVLYTKERNTKKKTNKKIIERKIPIVISVLAKGPFAG